MGRWVILAAVVLLAGCGQEKASSINPNARSKAKPFELVGKQTQSASGVAVPCPEKNDELRVRGNMKERTLQYRCYGADASKAPRRS